MKCLIWGFVSHGLVFFLFFFWGGGRGVLPPPVAQSAQYFLHQLVPASFKLVLHPFLAPSRFCRFYYPFFLLAKILRIPGWTVGVRFDRVWIFRHFDGCA